MRLMVILMFILFPLTAFGGQYNIDNIYGDYLISGMQKKISMNVDGASLITVLKALSKQSGFNFISTEAAKKRSLTLYLKDVPLKKAMDIIFKANGLAYDYFPDARIFVVKEMGNPTIELKTKVYILKYSQLANSRFQNEVDDTFSNSSNNKSNSNSSSSNNNGILQAVGSVLTANGRIAEDVQSNSLVVVDVPSQFPVIDKVIQKLDRPVPQVMIEVEMLDVSKHIVDQLGIDYQNGLTAAFTGGSFTTVFPFNRKFFEKISGKRAITSASSVDLTSLQAVLKFLSENITTKFLARPKILTLANETAEVNLTTDAVIGITSTVSGTSGSTTQELERANIGTQLRVTPQVNMASREITLLVEVYTRVAQDSGIKLSGSISGNVKNPEERGAKSVVRLKDGETLLLGGLMRQDNTSTTSKIPFLGDIPILGSLFRYRGKDNVQRELLVFLTPHIVSSPPAFRYTHRLGDSREQSLSLRKKAIDIALDNLAQR